MKNLKTRLVVLLLSTFSLLTGAYGQIAPSQDAYTFSQKGGLNYGSATKIVVESDPTIPVFANSYIQFDLSSIPSSYTGANVTKASLKLFVESMVHQGSFNVNLVNGSWTEFGITYENAPTLGTTIASDISLTSANVHDYVIVDVTSAVQDWLNGSQPNDGIALVAVGNSDLDVTFDSKENASTSHPPELDIVFAGGGTITGITTASGSGLTGGGTSGTLNLSLTACANNQILIWNNGGWGCGNVSGGGSGTVTSVGSGNGLTGGPITTSGTLAIDPNVVPLLSLENQFTASQSVLGSLTATYLGASGTITAGGGAVFPSTGNSPTSGSPSSPLDLTASASNGTTASDQTFRWQATNVDGATPSANLKLLFGAAGATPTPTGLSIAPNGIISFAANQTFPGGGGGGITSVTGTNGVNASTSGGSVTLSANQGVVAFQSDLTAGITAAESYASANFLPLSAASSFATLGGNGFTGNQTITGSLFASGNVGIGTTSPQHTLDVVGDFNISNTVGNSVGVLELGGTPFLHNIGFQSTFVGSGAGNFHTQGDGNTGFGYSVLDVVTGSYNSAVGQLALAANTSGNNNTAVGDVALGELVNGSSNIAIGSAAGFLLQGNESNDIYIGHTGVGGENNTIRIGTPNLQTAAYIAGTLNVANLNVTGTVTCGSGCGGGGGGGTITGVIAGTGLSGGGTSGTVTLNNTGVLTVAPGTGIAIGGTAQNPVVNINTNVVPQLSGGNSFSGNQNVNGNIAAAGTISGTTITGTTVSASKLFATGGLYLNGNTTNPFAYASGSGVGDNAFLGFAGESVNAAAPGDENTGVGYQALNVNGTGSTGGFQSFGNSAMGAHALFNNTTGNDNTASGTNTLYNNTAGNYNAANGDGALFTNTAGNNNTASGHSSLTNTTGSFNTASGSNALQYNAGGSYNTALGAFSGPDTASTGLTNSTAIGAYTVVSQSNSLVLGSVGGVNGCTSPCLSASVGIGTAKPQATLDVEGVAATPPTVNFGSPSIPATFTVNGNTTLANLTVTGTCTGCGSGGGGVTNVVAGTDLSGGGSGPTVTLNLNTSATDLRYSQLGAANTYTGTQTINSSTGNGITATSSSSSSSGLSGSNTSTSGSGNGVTGTTSSPLGSGVVGVNQSAGTVGGGYGVYGLASTPANVGVGGVNNTTAAGSAYGVFGQSFGSTGAGVYGTGVGSGVTGSTSSPTGSGVVATNFATLGNAYGVYAQSSTSPSGTGVYGTGSAAGVYGVAASSTGTGVVGVSNAGWAGFFQGSVNVTNNLSVVNNAQVLGNLSVTGNSALSGNTTVSGTLSVGGDTPMSHSPRMTFSGMVASYTTSELQPAGYFIPDQAIMITRFTAAAGTLDNGSCSYPGSQVGFIVGTGTPYFLLSGDFPYTDSHPFNPPILVPAGTPIYIVGQEGSGFGCQSGNSITATVEYAMQ